MIDGGLRKIFHKHLPGHWQAVETGGVGLGIPDSNFCINGVEGWVEFKATQGWRAGLRPEQVGWIERRVRNRGRVFVAVRRKKTDLWLFHGAGVRELACMAIREVHRDVLLGSWTGGPANWDWDEVKKILVKSKF